MRRIRGLEGKVAKTEEGDTTNDWNLLLNLKRELGISNEQGDLAASTSGDGFESVKAISAHL